MAKENTKKFELPFHVIKRATIPVWKALLIRVVAVILALLLCSILSIILIKADPIQMIKALFTGAFGNDVMRWKFLKDTAILLCIALAVTPAFKMKFWNIGAEGQTLIGALAAAATGNLLQGKGIPEWIIIILMFLTSILAGAVWGGIPAIFKAIWGTNETLFTLMMNYIATGLVSHFVIVGFPSTSGTMPLLTEGLLPKLGHEYVLPIVLSLVLTTLVYIYQQYTKQGYEISVVGESENTAKYIGISVGKVIFRTMLISGAICGFAGFIIVSGINYNVAIDSVGGMGFTAIMVSWLAKFNPAVMIGTSALITFLDLGASRISNTFRIDDSFPDMIIGIVLFFIIGCEFFINYQLKLKNTKKNDVKEDGAK